jgi:hypothetical protein
MTLTAALRSLREGRPYWRLLFSHFDDVGSLGVGNSACHGLSPA